MNTTITKLLIEFGTEYSHETGPVERGALIQNFTELINEHYVNKVTQMFTNKKG